MSTIAENIRLIRKGLSKEVELVAVSKYHPIESIKLAYACGQRVFGESHVQELTQKYKLLPKDIEWHFIGHLQTNKVKLIIPFISLIHAVDSFKLLCEINKQAQKQQRCIACLLQLHVANEESKFGFSLSACEQMLANSEWKNLTSIKLKGVMCMASNVDDEAQINGEFKDAYDFFLHIKELFFSDDDEFCLRSWGMSHDYKIAMRQGSTLVRIGSDIFGDRQY
ncbi:MAG: YggS family pyridoxal phosphate-dependent enzyme [Bacteroidaceae bacterium]